MEYSRDMYTYFFHNIMPDDYLAIKVTENITADHYKADFTR